MVLEAYAHRGSVVTSAERAVLVSVLVLRTFLDSETSLRATLILIAALPGLEPQASLCVLMVCTRHRANKRQNPGFRPEAFGRHDYARNMKQLNYIRGQLVKPVDSLLERGRLGIVQWAP